MKKREHTIGFCDDLRKSKNPNNKITGVKHILHNIVADYITNEKYSKKITKKYIKENTYSVACEIYKKHETIIYTYLVIFEDIDKAKLYKKQNNQSILILPLKYKNVSFLFLGDTTDAKHYSKTLDILCHEMVERIKQNKRIFRPHTDAFEDDIIEDFLKQMHLLGLDPAIKDLALFRDILEKYELNYITNNEKLIETIESINKEYLQLSFNF